MPAFDIGSPFATGAGSSTGTGSSTTTSPKTGAVGMTADGCPCYQVKQRSTYYLSPVPVQGGTPVQVEETKWVCDPPPGNQVKVLCEETNAQNAGAASSGSTTTTTTEKKGGGVVGGTPSQGGVVSPGGVIGSGGGIGGGIAAPLNSGQMMMQSGGTRNYDASGNPRIVGLSNYTGEGGGYGLPPIDPFAGNFTTTSQAAQPQCYNGEMDVEINRGKQAAVLVGLAVLFGGIAVVASKMTNA